MVQSSKHSIRICRVARLDAAIPFAAAATDAPPRASKVRAAWTSLPGGVVDGGEIVILAIKPSMWRPVMDSTPWLVTCCTLAAALTWLVRPFPGLTLTGTSQVLLLLAFVRLGMAVIRWIPTWYVLTNRRIIDIRGVRAPQISSCPLSSISGTYLHSSTAERIARLGTITFDADQSDPVSYVWQSISQPEEVHAKIRRAIENANDLRGLHG